MPFAKVNGINLHYRCSGNGEPLILVAGWGTDLRTWIFQLPTFRKHFQAITFDNRGVGRSDKPTGPYSMRLMAADVIGLMDYLHIKTANVLGLSMGGMIAQEVAINYPDRVIRLILGCTFASRRDGSGPTDDYIRHAKQDVVQQRILLASLATNNPITRFFVVTVARLLAKHGIEGFKSQGAAIRDHDTTDRLHSIMCPTLVVAGTKDRVIRPKSSELVASRLPRGRLVMIANGSHSISSENRQEFNQVALRFLLDDAEGLKALNA